MGTFTEPLVINSQETGIQTLTITLPEVNNSSYQIRQYPKWMEFQQMSGYFSDGLAIFNFRIINEELNLYGYKGGEIILAIKDFGLVSLNVTVINPEQNNIFLDRETLDFRDDIFRLEFRVQNQSTNNVSWKVIECPDWAKPELSNGMINSQSAAYMIITCDRTGLPHGLLSGQLKIEFEWWGGVRMVKTINLLAEITDNVSTSTLTEIEGIVADAVYCKETDRLFIATINPDRLLVYDNEGKLTTSITLNKSPNCLSLTENGQHLFIGHSGLVSFVDSSMHRINDTYVIDFNVYNLVYGENGWLYMSPDADNTNDPIIQLNTANGSLIRNKSDHCYSRTNFRKIKGKPLLLATRGQNISPAGIILIDISNEIPNQNETYWHNDFGCKFWLSDDHKYTYGLNGTVFLTPDYNKEGDILPLGHIQLSDNSNWMDYCAQTKSLWVAPNNRREYERSYVSQYHSDNYYLIKSYFIGNYTTAINGVLNSYKTVPCFIFSNKSGSHVFVIKNVLIDYNNNGQAWSMETLLF